MVYVAAMKMNDRSQGIISGLYCRIFKKYPDLADGYFRKSQDINADFSNRKDLIAENDAKIFGNFEVIYPFFLAFPNNVFTKTQQQKRFLNTI